MVSLVTGLGMGQERPTAKPNAAEWQGRDYRLYSGLTQEQSDLAHEGLRRGYRGDFTGALQAFTQMEKLESRDTLPPLSQLLLVASGVLLLERSDFADNLEANRIGKSVDEAAEQGQVLCRQALEKNRHVPTHLLIQGGIQGFLATRKIHHQPSKALQAGMQAMRMLEKALKADPRIKDAYLGSGIFECSASNAPLVVRGALKLLGRSVNFHAGLRALRISAYDGQYTSVASQLFLMQFLSPYEDEARSEKQVIFRSLETEFPGNPMYAFLRQDEALCFYPDSFYATESTAMEGRMRKLQAYGYAGQRYARLIAWQLSLLHPEGSMPIVNDTAFDYREWSFYPVFVGGLRRKREFNEGLPRRDTTIDPKEELAAYRDSCLKIIWSSEMTPTSKRYQSWRVRDALKFTARAPATYADPISPTSVNP